MKSIFNTLDIILGHLVAGALIFLLYLTLFLTTIVCLLIIPYKFFEGATGISELDALELGLLAFLVLVIWRFFKRGLQLDWRWWKMTRRFVFVVAIMGLIIVMFDYMVFITELTENGYLEVGYIYDYAEVGAFVYAALIILAIYAGAPLPKLWQKKESERLGSLTSENPGSDAV